MTDSNKQCLIAAIDEKNTELCRRILQEDAKVLDDTVLVEHDDYPMIVYAAYKNCPDIVRLFLEHGADVNALSSIMKKSAFFIAADHNYIEMAKTLLKAGANIDVQNIYGVTPIASAAHRDYEVMVALLLRYNPKFSVLYRLGMFRIRIMKSTDMDVRNENIISMLNLHKEKQNQSKCTIC